MSISSSIYRAISVLGRIIKIFVFVFVLYSITLFGSKSASAATYNIDIASGGSFSPDTLTINTGDTVTWTNTGTTEDANSISGDKHTKHEEYTDPTCDSQGDPNNTLGCWDSKPHPMDGGEVYSFTFWIGGTWTFHNHTNGPGPNDGTLTITDINAPATTTDLAASNPAGASVDLSWTSSGDDVGNTGNFGTPTSYDVRYSLALITEANWSSATPATDEPAPQAVGATETMTVSGLSELTTYYFALKTTDDASNESILSNIATLATIAARSSGSGIGDAIFPEVIADLAVEVLSTTSVRLAWSAPGDDGNEGAASFYDIRYNTKEITIDTWAFSIQVKGVPTPQVAGSDESITISGLTVATAYYFALNSTDDSGNEAKFSNIVSATTMTIDTTAPSAIIDLSFIKPSLSVVILNWTAPGDDEDTGTAKSYDLRYATTSLSWENWDLATSFLDVPPPREAGSKEAVIIPGLLHEVTYYIAIKTLDESLNESGISNIITFATVPVSPEEAIPVPTKTTKGRLTARADQGGSTIATTDDGAIVRMDVPPAAILQDTTFEISPIAKISFAVATSVAAIPIEKQIVGNYIFEYSATTSDAAVTTFPQDIAITFTYTTVQIARFDPSTLEISYYDEISGVWIPFIATLDTKANTITAFSDRVARFVVLGRVDTTPPLAPTLVRTKALGEGRIQITWTNPTEDFLHIKIYRSEMLGELGDMRASEVFGSEFTDTGVVDGNTYFYTVRSVDAAGNESENTNQAGAYAIGTSQDIKAIIRELKDGDLIRGPDGIKVYIINANGYKRHIFNTAVFDMYEHFGWGSIKDVSQEVLDPYITSDLYRADGDPKVYFMEGVDEGSGIAIKHHIEITSEQFTARGYDWNQVFVVNTTERDYYETGSPIK